LELIRQQATRNGLIKPDDSDRLTEQDVLNLIFEPGFTTASAVTEVSGRGVGMDVVRTVLDRLKGTVHVASPKNQCTTIQLRVALTLASIKTLLFKVGGRLFAVPLSVVVEITRISDQEIQRVDQKEVLRLRDQILTLVRLNSIRGIHSVEVPNAKRRKSFVIVIGIAEKRFGLLVP
jgi:two-component system chemotaxis sensor kinase CheA